MKILVFGNIGSGKSTLINHLNKSLQFEELLIDDFRRIYGIGNIESELLAREQFILSVKQNKNQIIECLGVGKVADALFQKLSLIDEKIICIVLITPIEICLNRIKQRVWDIPFHKSLDAVPDLMERTDAYFKSGVLKSKWGTIQNVSFKEYNFENPNETALLYGEIIDEINSTHSSNLEAFNDIEMMLEEKIQSYYGSEYLTYQNNVVNKHSHFHEERLLIEQFIKNIEVCGNLLDIGAGSCQWFHLFEDALINYYALDSNDKSLLSSKSNSKLIRITANVFADNFSLDSLNPDKINCVLFSFFLSHFYNESIETLLKKLHKIDKIIIIDSFWGTKHQEKYKNKALSIIKRKTSTESNIDLPKRFFEYSDIVDLFDPLGFSISKFENGSYWFVCLVERVK